MTAAQPYPTFAPADRFCCAADIPDPPPDAPGRKQYWEDTVSEAVAELRRRLASNYDEKSFQALQMILDLEKTRLRHKEPVSGTKVDRRFDHGLGSLEDSTFSGGKYQGPAKAEEGPHPAAAPPTLSVPERVEAPMPPQDGCAAQESDARLNTPSPERGGGRGVGSSPPDPPAPPPPHGRYRHVQYPLDAPINTMTDDEYNAYRKWQGYWPGVPPGWPNWPPKPAVPDENSDGIPVGEPKPADADTG